MNRKLKLWELDRVSEEEFKQQEKFPVIVILDSIRSLNNIGSFFRTADAFNVEKIYLCGITATPPHRDIQKTALGATESVEWEHRTNIIELIEELKKEIELLKTENTELKAVTVEEVAEVVELEEVKPIVPNPESQAERVEFKYGRNGFQSMEDKTDTYER